MGLIKLFFDYISIIHVIDPNTIIKFVCAHIHCTKKAAAALSRSKIEKRTKRHKNESWVRQKPDNRKNILLLCVQNRGPRFRFFFFFVKRLVE